MFAFTGATVVVSLRHNALFSASDLSTWVWFAVFGAAALVSAVMCVSMILSRTPDRRAVAGAT